VCGTEYVPKQVKSRSLNACSPSCKQKALRRRRQESGTQFEIDRRQNLKRAGGMSPEEYDEMYERQGGCCALCGEPSGNGPMLCVDHDHKTGRRRELLCHNCNRGLGLLGDDPTRLRAAADYVEKWAA
jgi:Recombination endonuclease VII